MLERKHFLAAWTARRIVSTIKCWMLPQLQRQLWFYTFVFCYSVHIVVFTDESLLGGGGYLDKATGYMGPPTKLWRINLLELQAMLFVLEFFKPLLKIVHHFDLY